MANHNKSVAAAQTREVAKARFMQAVKSAESTAKSGITPLPEGWKKGMRVILAAAEGVPAGKGTLESSEVDNGTVIVDEDGVGSTELEVSKVSPMKKKSNKLVNNAEIRRTRAEDIATAAEKGAKTVLPAVTDAAALQQKVEELAAVKPGTPREVTVYVKCDKATAEAVSQLGWGDPLKGTKKEKADAKQGIHTFRFTTSATERAIYKQLSDVEGAEMVDSTGAKVVFEKANTAPKRQPMPDGRSVHANEPKREVKWSERRVAIVQAMRKLGAEDEESACTAADISKAAAKLGAPELADRVDMTKICLDVYRTSELIHNGYAASTKHAGERELRYYLTDAGLTTTFGIAPKEEDNKGSKKGKGKDKGK